MKSLFKNEQSGRSMVEMLGVLAIIGVLSVGGIAGYSKAMAKFKLTKAQDQLSMMVMNIRTAFATSPGYPGLNTTTAIEYKLVSAEMAKDANTMVNALGGSTYVGSAKSVDDTVDGAFFIVFNGLGKDVCVSLATSDWGTDGMVGIRVKGEKVEGAPTTYTFDDTAAAGNLVSPKDFPIEMGDARTACASDSANSITWIYN